VKPCDEKQEICGIRAMTAKQFEKRVTSVLERKYRRYNVSGHKVWKEGKQLFLSVRFDPDVFRTETWGISAVFDQGGKCLSRSCGTIRDYLFTLILVRRIEEECRTYTGAVV